MPLHERAAGAIREIGEEPEIEGDVLAFLPGAEEIRRAGRLLDETARRLDLLVLPLHGRLPADEQDRALRPADRRKVVLATNVAETSLTIDGIRAVVDTGYARFASHDPARGLERLELGRISRASADQRAGRAGRTPGVCVRLWSEGEAPRPGRVGPGRGPAGRPGLDRARRPCLGGRSSPVRLVRAAAGRVLASAERLLAGLGALDPERGRITRVGRRLLDFPAHPRLARLVLAAAEAGRPSGRGGPLAAILAERDFLPLRGG